MAVAGTAPEWQSFLYGWFFELTLRSWRRGLQYCDESPIDYVRLTIEIPDALVPPYEVTAGQIGPEWRTDTVLTRRVGDAHFAATPFIPLKVPSVVVDTEWNLLFSRDYARAHASITDRQPVARDSRLWSL